MPYPQDFYRLSRRSSCISMGASSKSSVPSRAPTAYSPRHGTPASSVEALPQVETITPPLSPPSRTSTRSTQCCDTHEEGFIEVADELPTSLELEAAGEILVYDEWGSSRPFKSLYQGIEHNGQRQLIVFIRHFYCMACRAYISALLKTITPQLYFTLPVPTRITVIGCGSHQVIEKYREATNCPFEILAEPTRKLYKALGMQRNLRPGRRPEYLGAEPLLKTVSGSVFGHLGGGVDDAFHSGVYWQNGGELLFANGRPIWAHRMMKMRDHAEMSVVKKVLEMDEAGRPTHSSSGPSRALPSGAIPPAKGLRLVKDVEGIRARLSRDNAIT